MSKIPDPPDLIFYATPDGRIPTEPRPTELTDAELTQQARYAEVLGLVFIRWRLVDQQRFVDEDGEVAAETLTAQMANELLRRYGYRLTPPVQGNLFAPEVPQ